MPILHADGELFLDAPLADFALRRKIEEAGGATLGEQLVAAFERENWVASLYRKAMEPDFPAVEGFSATRYLTEEERENASYLADAVSLEHLDWLRGKRRREQEMMRTMERGPLPSWLAAVISGGLVDPVNLVPFTFAGRVALSARSGAQAAGRGALAIGGANAAIIAAQEAVMQSEQVERQYAESVAAVLLGGAFGAGVGAAAGGLLFRAAKNEMVSRAVQDAATLIHSAAVAEAPGTLSAARAGFTDPFTDDATRAVGHSYLAAIMQKLGRWGLLGPGQALAFSDDPLVRKLAHQLVSTGVVTEGHQLGLSPGISLDIAIRADKARYQHALVNLFSTGYADMGSRMSRDDFHREVALALASGDKHGDPVIEKTAKAIRQTILVPLGQQAKELGLIDGLLFGPEGVNDYMGYYPQRILADKVNQSLPEFRNRVFAALKPKFEEFNNLVEEARNRADLARAEREKLRELEARFKVQEETERLSRRQRDAEPMAHAIPAHMDPEVSPEVRVAEARKLDKMYRALRNAQAALRGHRETYEIRLKSIKRLEFLERNGGPTRTPEQIKADKARLAEAYKIVREHYKEVRKARLAYFQQRTKVKNIGGLPADKLGAFFEKVQAERTRVNVLEREAAELSKKAGTLEFVEDEHIWEIIEDYIDKLNKNDISRFTSFRGTFGALKARTISLPPDIVRDFGDTDAFNVLSTYINGMVADIETQRMFGWTDPPTGDLSNPFEAILNSAKARASSLSKEADEAAAAGRTKEAAELRERAGRVVEKARTEVDMLAELFRRVRGTNAHRIPASMLGLYRAAEQARNLNFMRLMGSSVLSNIPDFARVVLARGLTRTLGFIARDMVRGFSGWRGALKEARKMNVALETVLNYRMLVVESLDEGYRGRTRWEAFLTKRATPFAARLFLLPQWSDAMKALDSMLTTDELLRTISDVADGKTIAARRKRLLAVSGVSDQMIGKIAKHKAKWIETDGLLQANLDAWKAEDPDAADALVKALYASVNDTVISPGVGDIPAWMDRTEIGKLVGQFRKWTMASMGRVLLQLAQKPAMGEYGPMLASVALLTTAGMMSQALRDLAADGRVENRSARAWIYHGIDRSGLLGIVSEADAMAGMTTGWSVSRLISGELPPRFRERTALDQALGPTAGLIDAGLAAAKTWTDGKVDQRDLWVLRTLMPLRNWFATNYLLDELTGYQAHQDEQRAKARAAGNPDQRLTRTAQ